MIGISIALLELANKEIFTKLERQLLFINHNVGLKLIYAVRQDARDVRLGVFFNQEKCLNNLICGLDGLGLNLFIKFQDVPVNTTQS